MTKTILETFLRQKGLWEKYVEYYSMRRTPKQMWKFFLMNYEEYYIHFAFIFQDTREGKEFWEKVNNEYLALLRRKRYESSQVIQRVLQQDPE